VTSAAPQPGVRELLLVRHGESQGNVAAAEAHAAGAEEIAVPARDADVELSDLGRRQAQAVGPALAALDPSARPQALVSSTYVRAQQTAALACESAGLELPGRIDERLRDRELGVLDRLTFAGVEARYPEEAARRRWQGKFYHRPAGGESWADVVLRLRSWLSDLDHEPPADRVLVVAHDVVIALLRYVCEGLDEEQVLRLARDTPLRNASLSRFVREPDGTWSVPSYDEVSHLRDAGLEVTEHKGERHAGSAARHS
jgi:broad specificity phosphatase PhoE